MIKKLVRFFFFFFFSAPLQWSPITSYLYLLEDPIIASYSGIAHDPRSGFFIFGSEEAHGLTKRMEIGV
jgi:hypothetical protein